MHMFCIYIKNNFNTQEVILKENLEKIIFLFCNQLLSNYTQWISSGHWASCKNH